MSSKRSSFLWPRKSFTDLLDYRPTIRRQQSSASTTSADSDETIKPGDHGSSNATPHDVQQNNDVDADARSIYTASIYSSRTETEEDLLSSVSASHSPRTERADVMPRPLSRSASLAKPDCRPQKLQKKSKSKSPENSRSKDKRKSVFNLKHAWRTWSPGKQRHDVASSSPAIFDRSPSDTACQPPLPLQADATAKRCDSQADIRQGPLDIVSEQARSPELDYSDCVAEYHDYMLSPDTPPESHSLSTAFSSNNSSSQRLSRMLGCDVTSFEVAQRYAESEAEHVNEDTDSEYSIIPWRASWYL